LQYGNQRSYIIRKLRRDGFARLARCVDGGTLSAQFAKHFAATVPRNRLAEVTDVAERFGPNRWPDWDGGAHCGT
jgi:hypothetical protein